MLKPLPSCPIAEIGIDNDDSVSATLDDEDEELAVGVDPTTLPDDQWNEMIAHWDPRNNAVIALDGYCWFGK